MAADYHEIQFKQPHDFDAGDVTGPMQMIVTVKSPLADPVPSAPTFHASMELADTVQDDNNGDFDRDIRTTLFYYDFNPDWTMNYDRVADASLPYTYPTNTYNFDYKDTRDDAQGYTTVIWFTTT